MGATGRASSVSDFASEVGFIQCDCSEFCSVELGGHGVWLCCVLESLFVTVR